MADEGIPDFQTSLNISTRVNARSIECPICLHKLRRPKSLPCLHTFCEECLGLYVTKETAGNLSAHDFPCPICRVVTSPVDPSAAVHLWASRFPTNSLVVELTDAQEEQGVAHMCEPCKIKGNSNSAAQFWCKRMNSFFCSDCKSTLHDFMHVDCEVTAITNLLQQVVHDMSQVPSCPKHKKKTDMVCEDHQTLACSKCISIDHMSCELVLTVEDYYNKLQDGSQFKDMRTAVTEGIRQLDPWIKHVRKHIDILSSDKNKILLECTDFRQKVLLKLDELHDKLTTEVTGIYKEEKHNMEQYLQRCESMATAMAATKTLAEAESLPNDAIQSVAVFMRGNAEAALCESLLKKMETTFKPVGIVYESPPNVQQLKLDLGKVVVQPASSYQTSKPDVKPLSGKVVNEVSAEHSTQRNVKPMCEKNAIKVKKLSVSLSDKTECDIQGCLFTANGRIILTDHSNKKVKLMTDTGDMLAELRLQDAPNDLCKVDDTTIAFSRPDIQAISLVEISSSKLRVIPDATIKTGRPCYGITYHGGKFIVTTGKNKPYEVYIIEQTGQTTGTLYRHAQYYPAGLVYDRNHNNLIGTLQTSNPGDVAVYILAQMKHMKHVAFRGVLKAPCGIDLDTDGNMYVCGYVTNNVVQMSGDGTNVRELLTASDGVESPVAISVYGDRFVVACQKSDYVTIYQLV